MRLPKHRMPSYSSYDFPSATLTLSIRYRIDKAKEPDRCALEKALWEEALMHGDSRVIACEVPSIPWECNVCGCTDESDIDGDRICGCDSCSDGCESCESRLLRGAKRYQFWRDASIVLNVLSDKCLDLSSNFVPDTVQEILDILDSTIMPSTFFPTIDLARTLLIHANTNTRDALESCAFLFARLVVYANTGNVILNKTTM